MEKRCFAVIFPPCWSFSTDLSQLSPCVEAAEVSESDPLSSNVGAELVETSNRKEENRKKPGKAHSKRGREMCRTLWPAHPEGCFHLSLPPPPPTLFNVCHLRDSRGAAPVCLLARSPQIPPPAPACHSCCRASWDGGSEGRRERGGVLERGVACGGRDSWRA